jgi:hypothetical protein
VDVKEFVEVYKVLIVVAFIVSVINWLGYSILAPWYKSTLGRIIWTKFLANVLILLTPFLQVMFKDVPFRYEFSVFALCFFIISILIIAYGIYTTQIKGYLKYRRELRLLKKGESN